MASAWTMFSCSAAPPATTPAPPPPAAPSIDGLSETSLDATDPSQGVNPVEMEDAVMRLLRDPRRDPNKLRAPQLVLQEVSSLERLQTHVQPSSPDFLPITLRTANAYSELAVVSELRAFMASSSADLSQRQAAEKFKALAQASRAKAVSKYKSYLAINTATEQALEARLYLGMEQEALREYEGARQNYETARTARPPSKVPGLALLGLAAIEAQQARTDASRWPAAAAQFGSALGFLDAGTVQHCLAQYGQLLASASGDKSQMGSGFAQCKSGGAPSTLSTAPATQASTASTSSADHGSAQVPPVSPESGTTPQDTPSSAPAYSPNKGHILLRGSCSHTSECKGRLICQSGTCQFPQQ